MDYTLPTQALAGEIIRRQQFIADMQLGLQYADTPALRQLVQAAIAAEQARLAHLQAALAPRN